MLGIGRLKDQKMRKKISIIVCLFIVAYSANAQKPDSNLISRFRPGFLWFYGGIRPSKLVDAKKYDRLVVDVLCNDWINKNQSLFQNHWSSIGFNVQTIFDIPFNSKNTVGLGIGLGYGHSRIQSDYFLNHVDSNQTTILTEVPLNSGIEKSVFTVNKIFIPIEMRFRTAGWKHFKFQLGGRIGYQFLAQTHLFSKNPSGLKVETITSNFKDLNPLLMSVHARIGIRNWAFTASYNLNPYFKNKQSTTLNGLELGLSISLF
jgi:hypothetical protein